MRRLCLAVVCALLWLQSAGWARDDRAAKASAARDLTVTRGKLGRHGISRARVLALRVAAWPVNRWPILSRPVSRRGEVLVGMTEKVAAQAAVRIKREQGCEVTIGRVGPEYNDKWSAREAEDSFVRIIEELGAARRSDRGFAPAIALDPGYFGIGLHGVPRPAQEALASDAILRIVAKAKAHGVGLEMDMIQIGALDATLAIAKRAVQELHYPIRLALAARYRASDRALDEWAALARQTGLPLGVRLVKGSFLEGPSEKGVLNGRREVLDHFKALVTRALEHHQSLDVAVATHNEDVAQHAADEAGRLRARYSLHIVRGISPTFERKWKDRIDREYVAYGQDAPAFSLGNQLDNLRARLAHLRKAWTEGRDVRSGLSNMKQAWQSLD